MGIKKCFKAIFIIPLFIIAQGIAFSQSYLHKLDSEHDYFSLQGSPLTAKFSGVTSVKFIYHIDKDKLYFVNSKKYKYHFDFCQKYFHERSSGSFFRRNYGYNQEKRRYLLGNLNKIVDKDTYFFDLSATDKMSSKNIERLYELILERSYIEDIKFFPNSAYQQEKKGNLSIPIINANEIFRNLKYQIINAASAEGVLKKYTTDKLDKVKPNEIVYLDETPNSIPLVRGIIVNQMQTPLSHIVLLASNRDIPIIAINPENSDSNILALLNQNISFKVDKRKYELKTLTELASNKKNVKPKALKANCEINTLINFDEKHGDLSNTIGVKAANFYHIYNFKKEYGESYFSTPENAFAIPFYHYKKHILDNGIDVLIDSLHKISKDSIELINRQLKIIRKKIKSSKIDSDLKKLIHQRLDTSQFERFRFRSSSNAEDLKGFNGAGLYTSKTGVKNHEKKTYERAIKKVWTSLWNEQAFWERLYYNIDESNLAMGILVHRSFPNEKVNGVIITKNIYRNIEGITINSQLGDYSLVKPEDRATAELLTLINFGNGTYVSENIGIDYAAMSSINENKPLLSRETIIKLYRTSFELKEYLNKHIKGWNEYDIEYKIDQNDIIYFKQARIYNE